ncbi:MAG: ATP-binding protein [Bacteroidaceae bacterium]|nr:ATP-binding protein [Bacteroidaceae bacterium]
MEQTIISKRDLETILLEQKGELLSKSEETLCSRKEEALIDLASPQAQVVIGVRRSGKSTLCFQTLHHIGEPFAYIDFDDERLSGISTAQLNDMLEVLYKIYGSFKYIFLDEIQDVEAWPLFVNRLLRQKIHVLLTGSNAKLLSSDLATHLTGRSSEVSLYPFSFAEYCEMKGVDVATRTTEKIGVRRAAFDDFMEQGGFPELMQIKNRKQYVSNLVDNILKRDIEQRYNISYKAGFEALANHLLNVSPTIVTAKALAEAFSFKSIHTVTNYINYLKQAYVLIGVKKYSAKSKLRAVQEKVYAVDVALMNQREDAFAGDNLGWRLETLVLNHLVRRCKMDGTDVCYFHERYGECDFLVCAGNRVLQCIQVSYDISNEKTRKREVGGLLRASERTGCDHLLLLTDHHYEEFDGNGKKIKIQPVYEWALENN